MRVSDALDFGKSKIHSDLSKILLGDLLGKNPLELYLMLEEEVPEDVMIRYQKEIMAIQEGTPIQYAIGHVHFYGNLFYVDKNVLIPRFETEEVVSKAIQKIEEMWPLKPSLKAIDLGCGSGVIGLTLKKQLPYLDVTLLDISKSALEVAKKNKEALHLDCTILQGNMLEGLEDQFDIIISNPPYIQEGEEIDEIVKENEPALALYGGPDGLQYYDQILKKAKECLRRKFLIVFEIGCTQKKAITNLALRYLSFVQIECFKDLQGRDRILVISSKED